MYRLTSHLLRAHACADGDLPRPSAGIGELGAGLGLRLIFRTYVHERVIVMWRGNVLHTFGFAALAFESCCPRRAATACAKHAPISSMS